MIDMIVLDWYMKALQKYWAGNEPDLVSVIAAANGWKPLHRQEEMTVHAGNKEYKIQRIR